ncbi:ATP-binding cassette domain-containing protein [Micrococcales bacterium 31B]|nr:ATP-binding cassette domain-containing protein [Micrococcales bacterium 31B]
MLKVENLTRRYGNFVAANDVSFECKPGTITGFLGPNGAGKSTTLRMITGLTPPHGGHSTFNGVAYKDMPNPGRVVGVMLDASAQHAGRTGLETLELAAMVQGLPKRRAKEMLDIVGLHDGAKRRVKQFSLGMRQRLGIGAALLGSPQFLILDEPANGLDPEGIRWMRHLLLDFAARGGTVLLSSHLLHEVQATVDELVVIGRGQIVAQGHMKDLLRGEGTVVRSSDDAALARALQAHGLAVAPRPDGGIAVNAEADQVGAIALEACVALRELRGGDGRGLEDLYFHLTSDSDRAAA